jgi:lipoprotein-anchoring transpeptidase ErfK/SrfK
MPRHLQPLASPSATSYILLQVRKRAVLLVALVGVLVLALGGAVYAFDSSRSQTIAEGVRVSGVDVGGMKVVAARTKLRRELLDPLRKPVAVRYKGRRFRLTPAQAKVGVDVEGSVDRALAKSREAGILARTLRDVRGKRVDAEVPVSVVHSEAAIKRLVARVGKALAVPAKDATVSITAGGVSRTPSRDGRALRANALRREVRAKLLSVSGGRTVRAHTRVVRPKVSTAKVAEKYPAIIIVDRKGFRLTLYKELRPAETYGIAVGKVGLETPAGEYSIQNKAVDPAWHVPDSDWAGDLAGKVIPGGVPENPIKARWLGVYDGVGIHGTGDESSIGSNASHGCIRMRVRDVKKLYDEVPVGAPIYIA